MTIKIRAWRTLRPS